MSAEFEEALVEQQSGQPFNWSRLEKLETAISWRRDEENAPLANVWHLETVA